MTQDDFFICKAEEGGVAVATATDDNAADEKSDKSIWRLLNIRCTRSVQLLSEVLVQIGKHSRIMKITKNTIITRREMFL